MKALYKNVTFAKAHNKDMKYLCSGSQEWMSDGKNFFCDKNFLNYDPAMQRNQAIYIYTQQKMLQFMYELQSHDKSNADQRFMPNNTP